MGGILPELCMYFNANFDQLAPEQRYACHSYRRAVEQAWAAGGHPDLAAPALAAQAGYLIVQRKELSGIPQSLFPGLRVGPGGDAVPPLTPFGQVDRVSLGSLGSRGGEDDLQQPPGIRQRQAVRGFSPPAAAPAGPGTTSPA